MSTPNGPLIVTVVSTSSLMGIDVLIGTCTVRVRSNVSEIEIVSSIDTSNSIVEAPKSSRPVTAWSRPSSIDGPMPLTVSTNPLTCEA